MVTKVQKDLIRLLKSLGLSMEDTVAELALLKTDENRRKMIDAIIARYDSKGAVTEQDIQKIGLMLTGSRKELNPKSDGRAAILILRSIRQKGLQEITEEKIFQHLLNTARGEATEKRAEELIKIIEDPNNTEADILKHLEKLEKQS